MDIRSLIAGVVVGAVIALILDNAWVRLHLARMMPGGDERDALRHAQEAQLRAVARAEQLELELDQARTLGLQNSAASALTDEQHAQLARLDALTAERDRIAKELETARAQIINMEASLSAAESPQPDLEPLTARISELETQNAQLMSEKEALNSNNDQAAIEALESKHAATLQEFEAFKANAAADKAAHTAEVEQLRNTVQSLGAAPAPEPLITEAELRRLQERAELGASLATKTEQLLAERDSLVSELATLRQRGTEATDQTGLKERLMAMSQESAAIKRSLASAYAQIETMKVKLSSTAKSDLTRVPGLSVDHASKLSDSGIRTYDDLARARTESLMDILELSDAEHVLARSWQDEARKLAERGEN